MVDCQARVSRVLFHMAKTSTTAIAHSNIAFIKYWGNIDPQLRLPANGSLSMTLADLETSTTVKFDGNLNADQVVINGEEATGRAYSRVEAHLDRIRGLANLDYKANVNTKSNFPIGTGLASSASGFAALTLAATKASGLNLPSQELSVLARKASGSACRSIFGGFVEWYANQEDQASFAEPIADENHWDLVDVIAIVREKEKEIGSTNGHGAAESSPLQNARVSDSSRRLEQCRRAILERDFSSLYQIIEEDSNLLHSVMLTSRPPIIYWEPVTISIMQNVVHWREEGLEVCYTIDAGPNVHCICSSASASEVEARLGNLTGVRRVLTSRVGGPARII